jgi:hypothetical protein
MNWQFLELTKDNLVEHRNTEYNNIPVYTAMDVQILVFWIVTSCGVVRRHRRFGGTFWLHLRDVIILPDYNMSQQ